MTDEEKALIAFLRQDRAILIRQLEALAKRLAEVSQRLAELEEEREGT